MGPEWAPGPTSPFFRPKVLSSHPILALTIFSSSLHPPSHCTSPPKPPFSHQLPPQAQESQGSSARPTRTPEPHMQNVSWIKHQDLSMSLGSSWIEPG